MTRLTTTLAWLAAALGIGLIGLAGACAVALLANGVLSTTAPAWTTEVRIAGRAVRVNVTGMVRLATAPGVARLLDGRVIDTAAGPVQFRREGRAVVATCAPCRLQHPTLAGAPLDLSQLQLSAARSGATVSGWLAADGVRVDFTAQLATDRIRLHWQLPVTELADAFRTVATVVPEARHARIEGTVRAQGLLELPRRRGTMVVAVDGFEVGGLGTEALQFGAFRLSCPRPDGAARRVMAGDGEPGWSALDRMGVLPAAVIAAEDQRFRSHGGFDAEELAALLAELDAEGPQRGASTLTQQLARTLFTGGDRTVARKLRELLYAVEMERTLGKERIVELYLNTVHWGPGLCGARAAARTYFGKRPDHLTPLEAAWLAGILRAPHDAHVRQYQARRPDLERARRVLMQMRELPRADRVRWAGTSLDFAAARGPARSPLRAAAVPARSIAGLASSAPRQPDRDAAVAEAAVERTEAAGDRRQAMRAAAATVR